jgi:hypothetical protein
MLLGYVERALAAPRPHQTPVTPDFWDQVRLAEQLEELRLYRPAAYQALPKEPGLGARGAGLEEPRRATTPPDPEPGPETRDPGPGDVRPEGAPR